jgi:hypothetical protein
MRQRGPHPARAPEPLWPLPDAHAHAFAECRSSETLTFASSQSIAAIDQIVFTGTDASGYQTDVGRYVHAVL